jgi:hypothetical protein
MSAKAWPLTAAALLAVCAGGVVAAEEVVQVELAVAAPDFDCADVPLHTPVDLPAPMAALPAEQIAVELNETGANASVPGQIVRIDDRAELWWIAPQLQTGRRSTWTATLRKQLSEPEERFAWKDTPREYLDALWSGRPVLRYMYAHDASTPERLHETYKPYHHVFDAAGRNLLTKGSGGLYPHHRGIFVGWNKLGCAGKEYDFWHMKDGISQRHEKLLYKTAGPVLARSEMLIHWIDADGQPVVIEKREVTLFRQPSPTIALLDFRADLTPAKDDVVLDGDPEHAGVQYRAHNGVAEGGPEVKATYRFHEDGIDPHEDRDLPWAAMSYGLDGRRYSVQHMNHPDNPKPTVYSAYRDYGRFGAFFTKKVAAGETLPLCYRIWVVEGDLPDRATLAARRAAFTSAPRVTVASVKTEK